MVMTLTQDEALGRPNCLEVDLGAIAHNTGLTRKMAGPDTRIFAALKANAYGFGLVEVARTVLAAGADALAMVDVEDAIELREHGIRAPILLYAGNLATNAFARAIEQYDLIPSVVDADAAMAYSSLVSRPIKTFVKVDVGLERNGTPAESTLDLIKVVCDLPHLKVEGVYTHMHMPAEGGTEDYMQWQYDRFIGALKRLRDEKIDVPVQMAASSSILRMTGGMMLNAIDPGHVLYGLTPPGTAKLAIPFQPAFRALKSRLVQVKEIRRTDFVEQAPFDIKGVHRMGVFPMGRADGIAALNCGQVLLHGRRARMLGRPSLEHSRVDLTAIPEAAAGDEVVIIGSQGQAELSLHEVMAHQGMERDLALALEVRSSVRRAYSR